MKIHQKICINIMILSAYALKMLLTFTCATIIADKVQSFVRLSI